MPNPAYRYAAVVLSVHDGDSVVADVDLGFGMWMHKGHFRLLGLNARELDEPGGPEACDNLAALLPSMAAVTLTSVKPDKYGERWLAVLTLADGAVLNDRLIAEGWAAAWNGRGVKPLPPWPREPATT